MKTPARCPNSGRRTKGAPIVGTPPNQRVQCENCGSTFALEETKGVIEPFPEHFFPSGSKVEKIYAFMAIDADGNEGVLTFIGSDKHALQMVGANLEMLEQYRPVVKAMADSMQPGVKVKLVSFSGREDVEVVRE